MDEQVSQLAQCVKLPVKGIKCWREVRQMLVVFGGNDTQLLWMVIIWICKIPPTKLNDFSPLISIIGIWIHKEEYKSHRQFSFLKYSLLNLCQISNVYVQKGIRIPVSVCWLIKYNKITSGQQITPPVAYVILWSWSNFLWANFLHRKYRKSLSHQLLKKKLNTAGTNQTELELEWYQVLAGKWQNHEYYK